MTEIEEKFFAVFGIEPNCSYLFLLEGEGENEAARTLSFGCKADLKNFIVNCGSKGRVIKTTNSPHIYYPEITDRILLELICILNEHYCNNYQCATMLVGSTIDEVKRCILVECLENEKYIKDKVKALFESED